MAFKLDFAKLMEDSQRRRAMPPEERAALEAREEFERNVPHVVKDEKERDAASIHLKVVTLIQHPDVRFGMSGEAEVKLYFAEPGVPVDMSGDVVKGIKTAVYKTSEAERLDGQDDKSGRRHGTERFGNLDAGSKVTLLGSEKPRRWKGPDDKWRTVMEFHAARAAPGVLTREQLMARTPGGMAERSEAFIAEEAKPTGLASQAEKLVQSKAGLVDRMTEAADMTRYVKGPDGELPMDPRRLRTHEGR